ncbi:MAG: thioredoxin family protein [Cyclobacteriaceae bacterium]
MNKLLTPELIAGAMNWNDYYELTERLVSEGKTSGPNQTVALINFTRLNLQRMKRVYKTTVLTENTLNLIKSISKRLTWLVITEPWCGDAAQNLPVIVRMAEINSLISLKVILRDEHLEIMDAFLTNGGRSIPKLICLDTESLEVIGSWGPRPQFFQDMVLNYKKNSNLPFPEFVETLHKAYTLDKGHKMQQELSGAINNWLEMESKKIS